MDNGIVLNHSAMSASQLEVLILIEVDNGIVHQLKELNKIRKDGLNPYCSGQWYRGTVVRNINVTECESLNPYCSGQWYRT